MKVRISMENTKIQRRIQVDCMSLRKVKNTNMNLVLIERLESTTPLYYYYYYYYCYFFIIFVIIVIIILITGEELHPDIVICDNSGKWYVLELTCCYETNISKNISRKAQKYDQLVD